MTAEFDGRTAIVTGAAHGFGRAIASPLPSAAPTSGRATCSTTELDETARLAASAGGRCAVRVVDVGDRAAVGAFVAEAAAASGRVDMLVNNAGGVLGQVGRPLEESRRRSGSAIFACNVDGAFFFSQAVAPGMKAARWGRIVNISSGAGLGVSLTGIQAYASAKAAQIGLTRQLAHELGPWGITVNNIAPGLRALQPGHRTAVAVVRARRPAGARRAHRAPPSRHARRHRATACCSSPPTRPAGSPDRSSPSTAASDAARRRSRPPRRRGHDRILDALVEFASIPSVSTDPAHAADVTRRRRMGRRPARRRRPVPGADHRHRGQPGGVRRVAAARPASRRCSSTATTTCSRADPLEKWHTPPFTPTVRDGRLYARGVSDDKGPMLIPIEVAAAFFAVAGALPVNVKCMFEGEEEIGSPSLDAFIRDHQDLLAADVVLSADGAMWRIDEPSLTVASRGLAGLELTLTGAAQGPALGAPRRQRRQSAARDGAAGRRPARRRRARGRGGLLRRRASNSPPAERAALAALPFDEASVSRRRSARRRRSASRATPRSSGSGRARRSRSTACGAATRGPAARP